MGAQKQMDAIGKFLDSIDDEMRWYLKNASAPSPISRVGAGTAALPGIVGDPPPFPAQKAAAPTGDTTSIDMDPHIHTPEQQQLIADFIAHKNKTLREMFERVHLNNARVFERINLIKVSPRQAADASRLLGGEYTGYTNAINSNSVQHILDEHGPDGIVDHSLGDLDDAARLEYILENYDYVEPVTYASGDLDTSAEFRNRDNTPAPMLRYRKKVDGTFYVVEAIPDSKYKKFWVVSAYMDKAGAVT